MQTKKSLCPLFGFFCVLLVRAKAMQLWDDYLICVWLGEKEKPWDISLG